MNRMDTSRRGLAELQYLDGHYEVIKPGAFVRCAITGVEIPLDDLKYWSVERQEAYASAEVSMARFRQTDYRR